MHRLVPSLITDQLSQNRLRGGFSCAALFVDISGFTLVTETLMKHGQYGAEVLAMVMRTIFTPVIQSVYEQGGFVTNFAGDALMAVFRTAAGDMDDAVQRALAATWQIQRHMATNAQQRTEFGVFSFSAKAGLAAGDVKWGIIVGGSTGQAAYYFKGMAIEESARAEQIAKAGEIIADSSAYEVVQRYVIAEKTDAHWRIRRITATLPEPQPVDTPMPDIELIARFFPRSLVEQEISGEFRQVLNLFVNLQGTPKHAALTVFMGHVFQLQERYGGVLNRIDFVDKGCHLLLFWGAPISYENDVTRALDFILDLREASNLPIRAGLTYRIAHAGSIGSPLAEEFTCYGRGVNLAARLMMSANWQEIWLDEEVAQRAESEFRLQSLGSRRFKGFAESQPVYRVSGWRDKGISHFGMRSIIGRQEELQRLHNVVQPIFEGRFAGAVVISGEAGIGKSHLVQAFLDQIDVVKSTTVFLCQTDEILRQSLNPFRSFLHHYFEQSAVKDERANEKRFTQILERLLQTIADDGLAVELSRTRSFLGSLVGLRWADSLYEQLDPELRYENTLDALKTLFKAESLNGPVIIQLEDAHWLDQDSKEFLARLTRNVADYPFVLLVTSRRELPKGIFNAEARQEVLALQPLDVENLGELAATVLEQKPSKALVDLLSERTDGNPFFMEQMLLYIQENDLLERVEVAEGSALPEDIYLPTDVRAVLTARLDRLPQAVKDVVQKAAVLGREFDVSILEYMVDNDPLLESILQTAADQSVWSALDPQRYVFKHALLRDATYDMQIHSRLRQLHKLAAQAYEDRHIRDPDLTPRFPAIAYHFDKADERAKSVHYYGEAGEQAKANYSNTEAIGYFSRGLQLADDRDVPSRYNFLCGRETIYQWIGKRDEQRNDLAQLAELMKRYPDDLKQAELALRFSAFALVTGDYDTAVAEAKHSLEYSQKIDDLLLEASAYHRWGRTLWQQGKGQEAEGYLKKALALARAGQSREIEAECLYDMGMVHRLQTRYDKSTQLLNKATAVYEELKDEQGIVRCLNLHGLIDYEKGNFVDSREYYLLALELCRKVGWRYAETHILLNIGGSYFDLGDYKMAEEIENQALILSKEMGDNHAQAISLDTLGLIYHYLDRSSQAINCYNQAKLIHQSLDNRRDYGYVLTHLGYALATSGQYEAAESNLLRALQIRQELGTEGLVQDTLGGIALLALEKNKIEQALEKVSEILTYVEDNGVDGIELPIQVYLICYRVLSAKARIDPSYRQKALKVLNGGHEVLQNRATQLKDDELRQRFLEQVPYNRDLYAAWLESR